MLFRSLRLTEKVGVNGELVDNPVTELPTESAVNAKLKERSEERRVGKECRSRWSQYH